MSHVTEEAHTVLYIVYFNQETMAVAVSMRVLRMGCFKSLRQLSNAYSPHAVCNVTALVTHEQLVTTMWMWKLRNHGKIPMHPYTTHGP